MIVSRERPFVRTIYIKEDIQLLEMRSFRLEEYLS